MGRRGKSWIAVIVGWDRLLEEMGDPNREPSENLVGILRRQSITSVLTPECSWATRRVIWRRMIGFGDVGMQWGSKEDVAEALNNGAGQEFDRIAATSLVAGPSDLGDHISGLLTPGSDFPSLDSVLAVVLRQGRPGVMQLSVERVFDL